jgi:hypothetical protein
MSLLRMAVATLLVLVRVAHADVGFTFVSSGGHVAFAAADNWPVIAMQPKLPIAQAAFQIPNAADEGTPHSTNIVFKFYKLGSPQASESLDQVGKQYGAKPPHQERFKEWTIYRQDAPQEGIVYTVLDAKRTFQTVAGSVRLAWPHLPSNAKGYDQLMERTFQSALSSVSEHVGPYEANPNEVIRRPSGGA